MSLFDPAEMEHQDWLQSVLKRLQRFLMYRERSRKEVRAHLIHKKICQNDQLDIVLDWLEELAFLDDERFLRSRLEYRLGQSYGPRYIQQEMQQLGITREQISDQLARIDPQKFCEAALLKARQKNRTRPEREDGHSKKQFLYAYLGRRGFLQEHIQYALKHLTEAVV